MQSNSSKYLIKKCYSTKSKKIKKNSARGGIFSAGQGQGAAGKALPVEFFLFFTMHAQCQQAQADQQHRIHARFRHGCRYVVLLRGN